MTPVFVAAVKTDRLTPDGVDSHVTAKFVYDNTVYRVHLTPEQAESLSAQLLFVATDIKPELAGVGIEPEDNRP